MALPNTGTCSYNTVAWTSLYHSKVEMKPVKDSAGRAVVTNEYTIDVDGVVAAAPGDTTDATLTSMRALLEAPAGALRFTNKGFGTLNVNVPGGQLWDAAYGPWPEVLSWIPRGNDQSCEVRWRIKTQVPCESNPTPKGIIEWCWEESWDIDEDGYTTRIITGHLVVQATRAAPGNRRIPDNAGDYYEKIAPAVLEGFERKRSRKLSEDKRRLDFTFTDTEVAFPLPDGVSRGEVRHKVAFSLRSKECPLIGSLSGTLTIPARQPKAFAWDKIMLIIRSRAPVGKVGLLGQGKGGAKREATYLLQTFDVDDEMFGRSVGFNVSYLILGAFLQDFLSASRLWQSVPGTSFQSWRTSLLANAAAPRGSAGLYFKNSDDLIVDLCLRQPPPKASELKGRIPAKPKPRGGLDRTPAIDPAKSWIWYELKVRLIEHDRIARHKPLLGIAAKPVPSLDGFITDQPGSPGLQPPKPGELGGPLAPGGKTTGLPGVGVTSATPDILQRVSAPNYTIRLSGRGVRAGYTVPIPRVNTVGGVVVTQAGQDVSQETLCTVGGVPIYRSSWIIDYLLPDDPKGGLPIPETPIAG